MTWGRMGGGSRHKTASGGRTCPRLSIGRSAFPQVTGELTVQEGCAPSRIRTCAHGSGGQINTRLGPLPIPMTQGFWRAVGAQSR